MATLATLGLISNCANTLIVSDMAQLEYHWSPTIRATLLCKVPQPCDHPANAGARFWGQSNAAVLGFGLFCLRHTTYRLANQAQPFLKVVIRFEMVDHLS